METQIKSGDTVWFWGTFFGRKYRALKGIAKENGTTGVARKIQVQIDWGGQSKILRVKSDQVYIVKPSINLPA